MKITGYGLREAIRLWETRRDVAANAFPDSLKAFPGEEKGAPKHLYDQFLRAERAIAALQEAQARYNLMAKLPFEGEEITLCRAVKLLGPAGRGAKLWRDAIGGGKRDSYGYHREDTRQKDTLYQVRTLSAAECLAEATAADKIAGQLRQGVARANATEVLIADIGLDAALLV